MNISDLIQNFGFIVLIVLAVILIIANIRIVPQSTSVTIERLGKYLTTWNEGIHIKVPFIDRISNTVSRKEHVHDFPPQSVITKDNVTMKIDAVVYCKVVDPKLYTYAVSDANSALAYLTATTLRNIIGELELDATLTSREIINDKMRAVLDEATDPWGIKVNRVEVQNIIPPDAIKLAMEKQMKAERERREKILIAEGEKQSEILVAEGHKQSKILEAEADKEARILEAEAEKEALIKKAEGEAQSILDVQEAVAQGLKKIREAGADEAVIKLKSLEALEKVAQGNATKLIIPSDIQNMAGLVSSISETLKQ